MLIERVWNTWTVSHATDPNGTGLPTDRPHPHWQIQRGRPQQWRTEVGYFHDWWINVGSY